MTVAPVGQSASRTLNFLYVVVSVLPAILGLGFGTPALFNHATVTQTVDRYHTQCPVLSIALDSPEQCPAQTAQVVGRYQKGVGRPASQWVVIQLPTGQRDPVHISDPNVWDGITIGQQAVAQVWDGRVTGLVVNGLIVKTNDNPDIVAGDNTARLLLAGLCVAVCMILLGLPLFVRSATRAPYKRSIVTTGAVLFIGGAFKLLT